MGFVSTGFDGRSPSVVLAVSIALLGTSGAMAADADPVAASIQKFEHVRVINSPIVASGAPSGDMVGMRAFKDADSGEFRAPTADEAAALAPAAPARQSSRLNAAAATPAFHSTRSGGTAVLLDESSMQFSVVSRQADGSLVEICVPGEKAANEAVLSTAAFDAAARQQESRNDR